MRRARASLLRMLLIAGAASQLGATCAYSTPPVLSQGQGADTLGKATGTVAAEAGWGKVASWWDSHSAADFDVHSGYVGAARVRVGVADDLDVGLVGGLGPERAWVLGPEAKWRFAHLTLQSDPDTPGFHVALLSGVGFGAADLRYDNNCTGSACIHMIEPGETKPRHAFVAPYSGVIASGGIQIVQMYAGLRLAASETLGNEIVDLTLFPELAYGVKLQPDPVFGLYAEGDVAGGITMSDTGDTALIGYVTAGLSLTLENLWKH